MQAIGSAPLLLPSRQSPAASPVFCFNVAALGVRCSVLGKLISPHLLPYHTCISEGRRIQRITLHRMPKCCSDYSQTLTLQPIHERNTFSPTQESFSHHLLPYTELTVVPAHKPRNQKLWWKKRSWETQAYSCKWQSQPLNFHTDWFGTAGQVISVLLASLTKTNNIMKLLSTRFWLLGSSKLYQSTFIV